MLRHARHVTSVYVYQAKSTPCRVCGAPVAYVTCPSWYCHEHRPNLVSAKRARAIRDRARSRRLAQMGYAPVEAAPGFCRICGMTRLSVADVDGVCMGCKDDKG